MAPKTPTAFDWKKYIPSIKDIVFFIGIAISTVGWIRSETVKSTERRIQIENLTKAVNNNNDQLEKINTILNEQQLLNGKIISYMQYANK